MNTFDDILKSAGLNYEDLTSEERELYQKNVVQIRTLSIEDIEALFRQLRYAVERKLVSTPDNEEHFETNRRLKARLEVYMTFEMFVLDPKLRREEMTKQLSNIKK